MDVYHLLDGKIWSSFFYHMSFGGKQKLSSTLEAKILKSDFVLPLEPRMGLWGAGLVRRLI